MSRSKSNFGSLPEPWLANGPASLNASGPLRLAQALRLHAERQVEVARVERGLPPPNVSLSSVLVLASPPLGAAAADCEQGQDEEQQTAAQTGGHGSARVSKRP